MAKNGTRLLRGFDSDPGPFNLVGAEVEKGRALRVLVKLVSTPSGNGFAYVGFEATDLMSINAENVISMAFRLDDGCSATFTVEEGQKLWIAGTDGSYFSYHVYAAVNGGDGDC